MVDDEVGYWQRRLREEDHRARSSENMVVAKIHEHMAAEYASRLGGEHASYPKIDRA